MIERSQKEGGEASEEVEDRAVRNFRKIIENIYIFYDLRL